MRATARAQAGFLAQLREARTQFFEELPFVVGHGDSEHGWACPAFLTPP